MDSQSCEDTVSIASNDAFKDYGATCYHSPTDLSTIGCLEGLPRLIGEELIPRLDQVIQLLETQSDCSRQDHVDDHLASSAVMSHKQRKKKSLRKETRAAKRRNKNTKAKASAIFFQNHGRIVVPKAPGSTREEFNAAKRRVSTKRFTTFWPESEAPYDNQGAYNIYPSNCSPKSQSSW